MSEAPAEFYKDPACDPAIEPADYQGEPANQINDPAIVEAAEYVEQPQGEVPED